MDTAGVPADEPQEDLLYEEDRQCCGTTENSRIWCNSTDFSGLLMVFLAWLAALYGEFVVIWVVFYQKDFALVHGILYSILTTLLLASHAKTMLTNPGAVPRTARALTPPPHEGEEIREVICGRCHGIKPVRSHHCRICARCIVRMDHHCPWVNNCVGACNLKHFLLFLIYTILVGTYAVSLILYHFVDCMVDNACEAYGPASLNLIRAVLVIAVAATIFAFSMLMNQIDAILTGMGTVDKLKRKRKKGRIRGSPSDFKPVPCADIFGGGPAIFLFLPVDPYFTNRPRALGYKDAGVSRREDYEEV
ncbi:unnamed protein product [Discosporangium mesarthrocarpum]